MKTTNFLFTKTGSFFSHGEASNPYNTNTKTQMKTTIITLVAVFAMLGSFTPLANAQPLSAPFAGGVLLQQGGASNQWQGLIMKASGGAFNSGNSVLTWTAPANAAGILHIDATGNITYGSLNLGTDVGASILPIANGGTNTNAIGGAGTVAYSDGAKFNFTAVGTAGFLLKSNGAGAPTWIDPSTFGIQAVNGTAPINVSTVTGTATVSLANDLTLAVNAGKLGVDLTHGNTWTGDQLLPADATQGNNLIAAINDGTANSVNGDVVNHDATLGLTGHALGLALNHSNSWAADQLLPADAGQGNNLVTAIAAGTGVIPIVNGGTNTSSIGGAGTLAYSDGAKYNFTAVGTSGFLLKSNGAGAPTWVDPSTFGIQSVTGTAPINVSTVAGAATVSIANDLTLAVNAGKLGVDLTHANAWTGDQTLPTDAGQAASLVASMNGSTAPGTLNADVFGHDVTLTVASHKIGIDLTHSNTWGADQILPTTSTQGDNLMAGLNNSGATTKLAIAHGGTNTTTLGGAGTVAYSDGTGYNFTAVGTAGYLLKSNGAGAPTWIDPGTLGIQSITGTAPINVSTVAGAATVSISNDNTLAVNAGKLGVDLTHANAWTGDQTLPLDATQGNNLVASITAGTGIIAVANGGTGSAGPLTNNQVMVSKAGKIVEGGAMTDGQIMIGKTGGAPIAANLTQGTGISIVNSGNSITISQNANGTNKQIYNLSNSNYNYTGNAAPAGFTLAATSVITITVFEKGGYPITATVTNINVAGNTFDFVLSGYPTANSTALVSFQN